MAACNAHFYATRDPLGHDFTTAPEVSQLFGEMIGGWIGDLWQRAGQPPVTLVELGPGRGTLMADAMRLLARLPGFTPNLALVETSPTLRAVQQMTLAACHPVWHDSIETLPTDTALIVIANEFFDALPIRQYLGGGLERAVRLSPDGFAPATIPATEQNPHECSHTGEALMAQLARRISAQGGAALVIDYGQSERAKDTLQALQKGAAVSPFSSPGEADLTAHVNFASLAAASGLPSHGPVPQARFLAALGIHSRAAALARHKSTADAARIAAGLARLTSPALMGALFKAMAIAAPHWPMPAGFDS